MRGYEKWTSPVFLVKAVFFASCSVVYFNQHLGAAQSKDWSKYAFSTFFVSKVEKLRKTLAKMGF